MQSSMPELQQAGDDSDSIPSGLDDMSDDDEGDGETGEDQDEVSELTDSDNDSIASGGMPNDLGDSDDGLEFAEGEDDLIELSEGQDISSDEEPSQGKRKKSVAAESNREKRRKLRQLPTFASAEDYAKMIDDAPEDDI
jgi:ribosome biogenesis protein MAK21